MNFSFRRKSVFMRINVFSFLFFLFFFLAFLLTWIVRACTQYYLTNFQRMSCNFRDTKAGEKIQLKFLFFCGASENFIERGEKIRLAHNELQCRLDVLQLLYLHFISWEFDFLSMTLNLSHSSYHVYYTFLTSRKAEFVLDKQIHWRLIRTLNIVVKLSR